MGTLASIAGDLLWKWQHWSHQVWTTAGVTVAPNHFVNVHVNKCRGTKGKTSAVAFK